MTAAAEELEAVATATDDHTAVIEAIVADKGYHSNQVLTDLAALDLRTATSRNPIAAAARWKNKAAARDAVYANRRRIHGARGLALLRRRSESPERPNAHLYETGRMRRTHLRGHTNILKRLFVHIGGFNLGLLMRTPHRASARHVVSRVGSRAVVAMIVALGTHLVDRGRAVAGPAVGGPSPFTPHHRFELLPIGASE